MFSVARSHLALPTQFLFLVVNAFGVLLGIIYNASTPDLYENNAHSKIGWIVTWVMSAEVLMGLLFAYSDKDRRSGTLQEQAGFLPIPTSSSEGQQYRWSGDSGQGTERSSSSLQQSQFVSFERDHRNSRTEETDPVAEKSDDDDDDEIESPVAFRHRFFKNNVFDRFLSNRVPRLFSGRILKTLRTVHTIIERIILPFGFIAIVTGAVVYGGIFVGLQIARLLGLKLLTLSCSEEIISMAVLRILSRVESSFGTDCSRWVVG